ncbi:MAG: leader peptidase (prepilin peptidase) / N-methyltransferase [Parcubacteria group bacterium Gr01-1014_8]|nr:MAG: leader peptidase (prepilin peptidase) / N-methyltransferase [Parcubacteria group bacterium Gr01-1014_8]
MGRSACPSCRTVLKVVDLVPVFSFVYLGGACRYCKNRISLQYPLVEIGTALLFVLVGLSPLPIELKILGVLIMALFVAITVYDIYHTVIPDVWSYAAGVVAFVYGLLAMEEASQITYVVLGALATATPLFSLWLVSRGKWMGLGDVKLAFTIGFLLGPIAGPFAILCAFIIGAVVSVCILLPLPVLLAYAEKIGITPLSRGAPRFTMESEVPFGPFLIASCILVWQLNVYGISIPFLP